MQHFLVILGEDFDGGVRLFISENQALAPYCLELSCVSPDLRIELPKGCAQSFS